MFAFNLKTNELRNLQREEEYHYEIDEDEIVFQSMNFRLLVFIPDETYARLFKKESL